MDDYVRPTLQKFDPKPPNKPQRASHLWTAHVYGNTIFQKKTPTSTAAPLDAKVK